MMSRLKEAVVSKIEAEFSNQHIIFYMEAYMQHVFGKNTYMKIMDTLDGVENGFCGVETSYFTFPSLLAAQGVFPRITYEKSWGKPSSDGIAAATPQQRRVIAETLMRAGYKLVLPEWINDDYTPKNNYIPK